MTSKIDKILKNTAAAISTTNTPTSSTTEPKDTYTDLPGRPDCELCGGVGFLRRDLPVGHPDFGKIEVCPCRRREVQQSARDRLFALSRLAELQDLTFANFKPQGKGGLLPTQSASLEEALNQSQMYAQRLEGWLVLLGDYGCGKTHLAAAIGNFVITLGVPTLFLTVPDLLDSLRAAYGGSGDSFDARFEAVRTAGLLILDDFGTQNATPWAQEKLFQIVNYRYINRLPLVVTSNLPLRDFEGRIRSRLEDPTRTTIVTMNAPDYRRPTVNTGAGELSSLETMRAMTLENFSLRRDESLTSEAIHNLELALETARDFAENPRGWLVYSGAYATGKTHLAAAIGNARAAAGYPPPFVVVPDLMDHLRATFNPSSEVRYDRRFEEIRAAPLLILDDLGTQAMTPWVREKLFQIFNYRYAAELPTVITTADTMEQIEPRLRSRMMDRRLCHIIGLIAPPYIGSPTSGPKKRSSSRSRR
jgi:DNA replication protein DnaC